MAGKSVHRLRVQAFRSRIRPHLNKAMGFTAASVVDTPVQATPHARPQAVQNQPDDPSDRRSPSPLMDNPVPQPKRRRRLSAKVTRGLRGLAAPLIWLCLLAFCGGTGVAAFLWLTTIPPVPNCQMLPSASADIDRLYCAEQAARSGKVESLLAGLALAKNWSADHPLHNRANQAMKGWSKSLLTIAQAKADQGDLAGAIALARKIPGNSPLHQDVQSALLDWQNGQNRGQKIDNAIQSAFRQQDWQTAAAQIQALSTLDDQ